jgi:hypothetical protein
MAAGLGFKTFTTGEVLTAADTNGYLMQGVLVFADATARDAAITSPQEGQFAYLKDTNVTTYYTGSAWANLDTTGMTNPMTTTGDTIYSSSGSTPARLGIGTAGQVLTVNSGATAPEWATASSGSYTQIATGTLSSTSVVMSSIPQTYRQLVLELFNPQTSGSNGTLCFRINAKTSAYYSNFISLNSASITNNANTDRFLTGISMTSAGGLLTNATIFFPNYVAGSGAGTPTMFGVTSSDNSLNQAVYFPYQLFAAITDITLLGNSGQTMSGGTYTLYGVK